MFNEEEGIAGGAGMEGGAGGAGKTERTYVVQSGDTLSKIAKQYYGDAGKYMDIFNANTDKLSDPDKIQVGQELIIP
ncbi:MAG: LysM peptidoglycan-binding domain-containing protein [Ignavibacteria bacterium]|nr:LysM peptidoglycan-binding domain-containing protein [Ignavibacteria bacterium]